MKFNKLYKRSVTGAVLFWEIEVFENKYRTHSGQMNGAVTTTEWTVCLPKNKNRANATSAFEQAQKDALSKWKRKMDREHFVESLNQLDTVKFIQPMLAQSFKDCMSRINFEDKVWVQCKLNGARCIATKDGLYSRKGVEWRSIPHISDALKDFFIKHPNVILDGELFNEDLRQDLGSIISLISKKKITQNILDRAKQMVEYHVYDVVDTSKKYDERLKDIDTYINEIQSPCVKRVDSWLVTSFAEINTLLSNYEEHEHEGVIVRTNDVYEHKRSKHLLKYKSFSTEEFEIIGVEEGEGNLTGKVGKFVLKDTKGDVFRSSPTGSHEYWEQMWCNREQLIGELATVKYTVLTTVKDGKGGVPTCGKVIAIRNYE